MSTPSPKIEKMLKANAISSVLIVIGVSTFSVMGFVELFGWTFGAIIGALVVGWILCRLGIMFMTFFWQHFYYDGDYAQIIKEADDMVAQRSQPDAPLLSAPPGNQVMLKITTVPENIMGYFMETPFYEWIEVLGSDGGNVRMNFFGTMDLKNGITHAIPQGCILLPPGILYQVEPAVNTGT